MVTRTAASWAVPAVAATVAAVLTVGLASTTKISGARLKHGLGEIGVAHATDHEDGNLTERPASLDLTDHFAFREDTATSASGDLANVVFGQLSNPSVAFGTTDTVFETNALYEIHVSRVTKTDRTARPTGDDDVVFQFQFSGAAAPQTVTLTILDEGATVFTGSSGTSGTFTTTPFAQAGTPTENVATVSGNAITFFAGLRADPSRFDRARFSAVRDYALDRYITGNLSATLANTCDAESAPIKAPTTANFFNPTGCATNTFASRNVNAIVVRVPVAFLQRTTEDTVFDSWSSTSLRNGQPKGR